MKFGNPKQKMYTKLLKKALIKHSEMKMPETEAEIGANQITLTLIKAGDSLDVKTVNATAKWVIKQKTRYEDGELVYIPGEGVTDTLSGETFS